MAKLELDLASVGDEGKSSRDSGGVGKAAVSTTQETTQEELKLDDMEAVLRDQRNRFRDKLREAEAELATVKENLKLRDSKIGSLTADNTSLYGKIRYLQSYNGMAKARNGDLEAGLDDPTVAKYKSSYEEGMNPFEFF